MSAAPDHDILIMGGGLGGMVAGIRLRQAGFQVLCVEPGELPRMRVGESLDWSSPHLLRQLGLDTGTMVLGATATWKKGISIQDNNAAPDILKAPPWIKTPPFRFNAVTVHVDRFELDRQIYALALEMGVEFLQDSIVDVRHDGDRITSCTTRKHGELTARYYIDATGRRQLLGSKLKIEKREIGIQKVALWSYFPAERDCHGTSFYVNAQEDYLSWIWEIPITPREISVGCVLSAEVFKEIRQTSPDLLEAYLRILDPHNGPWRESPLPEKDAINACSFKSYSYLQPVGKNWVMLGEAAAFTDPLTSNGVTAVIRHCLWLKDLLPSRTLTEDADIHCPQVYTDEVVRIAEFFNDSIERAVYDPLIRRAFGIGVAVRVYTIAAFFFNAFYTRFGVESPLAHRAVFGFLNFGRRWITFWRFLAGAKNRVVNAR